MIEHVLTASLAIDYSNLANCFVLALERCGGIISEANRSGSNRCEAIFTILRDRKVGDEKKIALVETIGKLIPKVCTDNAAWDKVDCFLASAGCNDELHYSTSLNISATKIRSIVTRREETMAVWYLYVVAEQARAVFLGGKCKNLEGIIISKTPNFLRKLGSRKLFRWNNVVEKNMVFGVNFFTQLAEEKIVLPTPKTPISFEYSQLEEIYTQKKHSAGLKKRNKTMVVLESAPLDLLEEEYAKRKRLTSDMDLTADDEKQEKTDGSGVAFRFLFGQHKALVRVKAEQETEILNLKGLVEEEKKKAAAHQLRFHRMKECVVCQDEDRCVALFPCSHLALCPACQNLVEVCPICREKIEERRTIRVP